MRKTVWSPRSTILAEALAQARKEAGLHQSQVAVLMGNDQTVVSNIERGHRRIDVIEFHDFAQAIGRDPVELYRTIVERWNVAGE
jgi:transcriptional regulator with XRE-family HTH domain